MHRPEQPWFHRQQSESEWLAQLDDSDFEMREQAIDALRHIAAREVTMPAFWRCITQDPQESVRGVALHALSDIAYDIGMQSRLDAEQLGQREVLMGYLPAAIEMFQSTEGNLQENLLNFLAAMGSDSAKAVPAIVKLLRSAIEILPGNRVAIRQHEPVMSAILALGRIGRPAELALPLLKSLSGCSADEEFVRELATAIAAIETK